jgi:pimeloyl-ACP methyl ester carboxylesterase
VAPEITHVESTDGTTIACYVAGDGPPLVLVHGTSADHTRWAPVIAGLEAQFTTYAIDRRGRGASTDGREYTIELEFDVLGHSYALVWA